MGRQCSWSVDNTLLHRLRRKLGQQDTIAFFDCYTVARKLVVRRKARYQSFSTGYLVKYLWRSYQGEQTLQPCHHLSLSTQASHRFLTFLQYQEARRTLRVYTLLPLASRVYIKCMAICQGGAELCKGCGSERSLDFTWNENVNWCLVLVY